MLNKKDKIFIENIAKQLQDKIRIEKQPNVYNYINIRDFIKSLKYDIAFNSQTNYIAGNIIYLTCKEPNNEYNDKDYIMFQQELLQQIWKVAKKKYKIPMMRFDETDATYFFRAMLMPESSFKKIVNDNAGEDGRCNINLVAKTFNVEVSDVKERGRDLGIWNC